MSGLLHWRCLTCDASGQTKPTKGDIGRDALRHVEATDHGVTTSHNPVPAWFTGGRVELKRGAA